MNRYLRILLAALLAGVAGFALWSLIPREETRVRKAVLRVCDAASFAGNEGALGRLSKSAEVASLCTPGFTLKIELLGGLSGGIRGREELRQLVLGAANACGSYQIRIHDLVIRKLEPTSATVSITASTSGCGQRDFDAQEFQVTLKKEGTKWLIDGAQTVRTFQK